MSLIDLNPSERAVVRDCLRAAVEGPFFPDREFSSLFGLQRAQMKAILDSWPDLDEKDKAVALAINNSFNNLLGYPHGLHDNWSEFIPVSAQDLTRIYAKWKGSALGNYFDGFM